MLASSCLRCTSGLLCSPCLLLDDGGKPPFPSRSQLSLDFPLPFASQLGHGGKQDERTPRKVAALEGVRVVLSTKQLRTCRHVFATSEDMHTRAIPIACMRRCASCVWRAARTTRSRSTTKAPATRGARVSAAECHRVPPSATECRRVLRRTSYDGRCSLLKVCAPLDERG